MAGFGVRRARGAGPSAAGFSLVELMVVVAVLAILATLAVPSFIDRAARAQISEALPLADIAKAPIGVAWTSTKTLPDDNSAAGLPAPDKIVSNHVSALTVETGAIHMTFGNRANGAIKGRTLSLRPAVVEDAQIVPVAWVCGNASAPDKMTVHGENRTNLPAQYLPPACR
jgi:type IV pilus assembly protein PilA